MKSRMFGFVTETWNPIVGCNHGCVYCWAKRQAKRQKHNCYACYKFVPHFHVERLNRKFKSKSLVFVCSMADLFGYWIDENWIERILKVIRNNSETMFFLETKNPPRLFEFIDLIPKNVILSTTLETNCGSTIWHEAPFSKLYYWNYEQISRAISPFVRARCFEDLEWERKHVSIEPVLDFNMDEMLKIVTDIKPQTVSVGYDNYNNHLPEPSLAKTLQLISKLERAGIKVERKTLRKAWWEKQMRRSKR